MRGYVRVPQWYGHIGHIDELNDPSRHTGDASSVDVLCGFTPPEVHERPPSCWDGHVVLRVEDDGSLTLFAANYDSSG